MFEEIRNHNQAVAAQIIKGFTTDIEKAHNVGDVHPNGKWVWTQLPNGKYDWRTIKKNKEEGKKEEPKKKEEEPKKKEDEGRAKLTPEKVASFINSLKLSDGTTFKIKSVKKDGETPIYANVSYSSTPDFIGYIYPSGKVKLSQGSLNDMAAQRHMLNLISAELIRKFGYEKEVQYSDHPQYGKDMYVDVAFIPVKDLKTLDKVFHKKTSGGVTRYEGELGNLKLKVEQEDLSFGEPEYNIFIDGKMLRTANNRVMSFETVWEAKEALLEEAKNRVKTKEKNSKQNSEK